MMNHCLFCEINNGNIPCYKIYEDRETLVFLDVAEDVDGHMLAVPKSTVPAFWIVMPILYMHL